MMKAVRHTDASLAHRTIGDVHWHVRPDWESTLLDGNGLPVDEWLSLRCARKVKSHQRRAVYAVEHAGPGGGLVVTTSNVIQPGTRLENYRAMRQAVRDFGAYPIRLA